MADFKKDDLKIDHNSKTMRFREKRCSSKRCISTRATFRLKTSKFYFLLIARYRGETKKIQKMFKKFSISYNQ